MNLSKVYRPIKRFEDLAVGQKAMALSLTEEGLGRYDEIVGKVLRIREVEHGICEHYHGSGTCGSDDSFCPCFGSYVCLEDENDWYSSCYVILGDEYGRPIKE